MSLTPLLEKCRDQALERAPGASSLKEITWTKAFFELYADLPLAERQARSFAYSLENEPVYIFEDECLVGQIYQACPGSTPVDMFGVGVDERWADFSACCVADREAKATVPDHELYAKYFGDGAGPGHVTWDYGMILNVGVDGMLEQVANLKSNSSDPKACEFYKSVSIALNGLLSWVERHVSRLNEMAESETDAARKAQLLEMAQTCSRVPAKPATTFMEATQSFLFQYLAVMYENPFGGNGVGRLDYYLWPFLENDIKTGRCSLERAGEIIRELFIKLDERIHAADGWVEAVVVGGRKPDGSSAINPLSSIIIEAILDLNQTHPSVYVRLHDDAPAHFVDLAARYMVESGNRGQVYGDDSVIEALIADGHTPEDARHWGAGGCMEVATQGASCDLLFAFAHNISRTFEIVLNGGKLLMSGEKASEWDKTLADYASFDDLYSAFETELKNEFSVLLSRLDIYYKNYALYRPSFLLSSMVHDCLERGRSMNDGGARYPNYGGSAVGIPNVGDSLYAIRKAVFEDKRYTTSEVLAALRANFEGYEEMHSYLAHLPKFGSGNDEATKLVDKVLLDFTDILNSHTTPHGGHALPVILGFVWVVDFGLVTGATPDGRLAGRPLAHGLSPQGGAATNGITAAINDATSLSLGRVPGGASMMWDIDNSWAEPGFVRPVIGAFIDQGGHIFQGNTTSVKDLIEAQLHPEEHGDLMVRVGGYSARFCTLSSETQNEIIARHKFGG